MDPKKVSQLLGEILARIDAPRLDELNMTFFEDRGHPPPWQRQCRILHAIAAAFYHPFAVVKNPALCEKFVSRIAPSLL